MALFLEIKASDGSVSRTRLEPGRTRVSVRLGDTYRIVDDQTGQSPDTVRVKRLDNMLVIEGLPADAAGTEPPHVELAEFYTNCSAGSPCQLLIDGGASGASTVIDPGTAPIGALADGSFVLHDPGFKAADAPAASIFDSNTGRIALYGLGGLAVVGLAAGGGGGSSNSGGGQTPSDGELRFTGANTFNRPFPVLRGDGQPGAQIAVRIDTDNDGRENAMYTTTVDSNGRWEIDMAAVQPTTGSLPDGLAATNRVLITQTLANGSPTSLPTFTYTFDGEAPAAPVIATVAGDNVVNAAEKVAGVTVSGSAEPGAAVTVTWGSTALSTVATPAGQWSVNFPPDKVPPDSATPVPVTAVATDAAGNVSPTASLPVTLDTRPGAPVIATVADDNVVNAAEKAAGVAVSGSAAPGATVTVTWGGTQQTAVAANDGAWSVTFLSAAIPADNSTIPITAVATDAFGTVSPPASQSVTVNTAPAALTVAPVTGNDRINLLESQGSVSISGTSDPGADVTVTWLGSTNTVKADNSGAWSVDYTGQIPASNGVNEPYTVTATNPIGNTGSANGIVLIDTVAPTAPGAPAIDAGPVVNQAEKLAGVTLSGTGVEEGATVQVVWGTSTLTSNPAGAGGAWSILVPSGSIPADGSYVLQAKVIDAAGNESSASVGVPVTVDSTPPPVATITTPADGAAIAALQSFTVSGTAEPGATVTVTPTPPGAIEGAPVTATVAPDGTWSTPLDHFRAISNGKVSVVVTDAAGNTSTLPAETNITVVPPEGAIAPPDSLALLPDMLLIDDSLFDTTASAITPATAGWPDTAATTVALLVPLENNLA